MTSPADPKAQPESEPNAKSSERITYGKYASSRFWAIWINDELLVVTVYRKGARAVLKRFGWEKVAVEVKRPKLEKRSSPGVWYD